MTSHGVRRQSKFGLSVMSLSIGGMGTYGAAVSRSVAAFRGSARCWAMKACDRVVRGQLQRRAPDKAIYGDATTIMTCAEPQVINCAQTGQVEA